MKTSKILTLSALSTALLGSTAMAGGLDRATLSTGLLFKKGDYAEFTLGVTTPSVSASSFAGGALAGNNVANQFTTVKLGYKTDINEKFAIAVELNNQPIGVDIDYASNGFPISGKLSSLSATLLGKYKFGDRFSVYAGGKYLEANGSLSNPALGGNVSFAKDSGFGAVAGVAYEIPAIALRVALSYESAIDLDLATTGGPAGITTGGSAEAWTLEFQTGIAENTLLFGSVRRAAWSDQDVILSNGVNLSEFDDTTAYSLGIGRKLSDSFSMAVTLGYEESTGELSSALAPTDGLFSIGVGGTYTGSTGIETSLGISYSPRGDTTTTAPASFVFEDSNVITIGLKVGKTF